MQSSRPRALVVQVSDASVAPTELSVAPTELDTVSERGDDGSGGGSATSLGSGAFASGVSLVEDNTNGAALVENETSGVSLEFGVELPLAEDEFEDEFGRMNGTPYNYDYDAPPAPRMPRPRPVARSRSPLTRPRPRTAILVRSSAFGSGLYLGNDADSDAAYDTIARRIRQIRASGAAFYVGITENPAMRWADHMDTWDFLEVLAEAPTSRITAALESRLLREFGDAFGCQNVGSGGERPSRGSPHFCYVVVRSNGLLRRGRGGGTRR